VVEAVVEEPTPVAEPEPVAAPEPEPVASPVTAPAASDEIDDILASLQ
jgi:hypothetical protein